MGGKQTDGPAFGGSYRALLAEVSDMVTVSDRAGAIVYANPATERVTGYAPEEFAALGPFSLMHPEDRPRCGEAFGKLAANPGLVLELEHRFRRKDGEWRWAEGTFASRFDDAEVGGLVATVRDVTAREEAEEALRESEERLRGVLDSMAEGFALLGSDFTILDVNEETLRLDGRSRDELVGRTHWEAFPGTEDSPVGGLFVRVARERVPASLEHEYSWPDGRSLWLDMRAYPTREAGVAVFWRDTTDRKRAEDALRRSEARYRRLFETMDEGYVLAELIHDGEGRPVDALYLEGNRAASRLTGVPDFDRRLFSDAMPGGEAYWLETYDRVARSGVGERLERYAAPLGRWYEFYVSRAADEEGAPGGGTRRLAILFQDVTERRRAEDALRESEARQAFLLELGDAMRAQSSASGKIEVAARHLGERLGASRVVYAEYDIARMRAWVFSGWFADGTPPMSGEFDLEGYKGRVLDDLVAGQTVRVDNVGLRVEEPDFAAFADVGVQALLSVPLIVDGGLKVNVSVHQSEPRHWADGEVALVREAAERLWAEVVRARAEAALSESNVRFRSIANLVPDLLWSSRPGGYTDLYNQRWTEYTGQTPEQASGWGWTDAIHPDDREGSARRYREAVESGRMLAQEHRIRRSDGEYRWFLVRAVPVRDETGGTTMFGSATDIHDQRMMIATARESAERQAFLLKLGDAFRAEMSADAIGAMATRVVAEYLSADRCWILRLSQQDELGWIGPEFRAAGLSPLAGEYRYSDFPQAMKRIETDPLVVRDSMNDASLDETSKRFLEGLGLRSVLAAVLREGERNALWSLVVATPGPRDWTGGELKFLEEVAERTWAAIERARAGAALRESEEKYRTLVENVGDHAVFMLDAEGRVTEWTESARRVKGYAAEEAVGRHFSVFHAPEGVAAGEPERELEEAAREGRAEREGWRVRKDGERIWVNEVATAVRDAKGELVGFAKIARDLTERRELEAERERARARELTALAEAAERERISRELHDRVAHHMGVAHQSLELHAALRGGAPDRAEEKLALARKTTRRALDQTRALSAELKRLQGEELEEGLGAALRALAATLSDGVKVDVSVSGDESAVPEPVALQVYLATREAVRNAVRHSGGSRAAVTLEVSDGEVAGSVEDDGRGFDPEAVGKASPSWGVGLRSMRERTEMLGGSFRVDSAPGAGTRVEVRVPLDGRRP